MSQTQFSISWNAYEKNICNGLSYLQQHGEFVDMTLAAEGQLVRVHKMVLSLVSPYIKELIASADCPHPVIFLNQISFKTLSAVLEYIYTGEVNVTKDNLNEFVQAGKALHIKGLVNMDIKETEALHKTVGVVQHHTTQSNDSSPKQNTNTCESQSMEIYNNEEYIEEYLDEDIADITFDEIMEQYKNKSNEPQPQEAKNTIPKTTMTRDNLIQYTLSIHGKLQMILNRYIYNLKYTCKSGNRRWQCIYNSYKCPAAVLTRNDRVVLRSASHNHLYHDCKILKKIRAGAVFTTIRDVNTELAMLQNFNQIMSGQVKYEDSDE